MHTRAREAQTLSVTMELSPRAKTKDATTRTSKPPSSEESGTLAVSDNECSSVSSETSFDQTSIISEFRNVRRRLTLADSQGISLRLVAGDRACTYTHEVTLLSSGVMVKYMATTILTRRLDDGNV